MNIKTFKFLIFSILILSGSGLKAQSFTVSGKVTDATSGESIPGATVLEKGTTNGTVTDIEGNFSFTLADQNSSIVVTFIGYEKMEIGVNGRSTIDVAMPISITELSEVVVIGYGTQKKKVVTGAISTVSSEEITSTPVLRVEQALQGRMPGVQVTQQSGQPGEAPTVRVRGAGTTGNADPLYVVDGLVVGGIDFLNPGDIESMDVLKDAASAAIYGARAANGVILITTKSGQKGRMNISYSGYYGVQNVANTIEMMNADQYRMFMNEGANNAGLTEPFDLNEIARSDTDWQDALFEENAPISNHQVTVAGGSDKSTYSSSVSYFSQQGIIGGKKSQFDRFTGRINTTHKVNEMFNFGNNLSYSHIIRRGIESNQSFNGAYGGALNLDPLTPVFESDPFYLGQYPYDIEAVVQNANGDTYGISELVGAEVVNPLALIENTHTETRVDKVVGNIYGEFQPIDGLKFRTSFGIDLGYVLTDGFIPEYFLNGAQNRDVSSVNKEVERYFTWQWENTAIYSKKIGDHNFSGLVGLSAQEVNYENLSGFNANVPTDDPDNVYLNMASDTVDVSRGGAWHSALYSVFGRVTYDYKDKYLLTAIIRRDGSSKFGANKRFGVFPSIGIGWVMSDEVFFQNLGPVNFLKMRASWGINGNQEIGDYQFVATVNRERFYTFGGGRLVGASPNYIENQDIGWEESEQLDIALDFGLFENKLTGSIDYYVKTTGELLEQVPIPGHVGNFGPVANVGSVENKGFEIALTWKQSTPNFKYSLNFNAAKNTNTVTKIGNEQGVLSGASWAVAGQVTRAEVGLPIGYFWGYKTDGIFQNQNDIFAHINNQGEVIQPDAVPGDVRFVDVNNDGIIDDGDRTLIGNPTPDWTLGFTGDISYKGFDLSIFLQGALGHQVFNGAQRQDLRYTNRPVAALDRWTGEGTSSTLPRYTWIDTNNNYRVSDLYIEDASFVRIKNLQVGYSLPSDILSKIGATNWRFYVSVENLATFTGYSGADPEIGALSALDIGIDRGIYPQARTFRLGTSLTF